MEAESFREWLTLSERGKELGTSGLAVSGQQRNPHTARVTLSTQLRVRRSSNVRRIILLLPGFQRLPARAGRFVVGIFLEHPGLTRGSAIGEDDAVDVVLN